jgi:hypothetical protein
MVEVHFRVALYRYVCDLTAVRAADPRIKAPRSPRGHPAGAENCVTLCDLGILADQAAEPVPAENPDILLSGRVYADARQTNSVGTAKFSRRPPALVWWAGTGSSGAVSAHSASVASEG